ncbi:MAG TPA: cohesin domain-containing protein [Bryobacteraceae bacterium]|nr:cohesin domain-containing protein [Bryobacteraceae bacterium]
MKQLVRFLLLTALLICIAAPGWARNRKAEKLLKEGQDAEIRREYEKALDLFEKAMLSDPSDPAYQLAARRVRFQAGMARIDAGQKLRNAGKLEEALQEFLKAYAIDPSSAMADQEIRRTREMIEREKNPGAKAATPEARGLTPAQQAQKASEEKSASILSAPELKPITREIVTLKMNNQPVKLLYETVGKVAGINVVFDSEYQPPPGKSTFTVDLANTTLEEALDYLAVQTKSFWKPLSSNTIFVTSDNPTKRRDYEDYVVRVFYIKNATTIQELQEIATTVRSVTEIRRAFTYNAQNAILVRGTTDQVALAEKLIQDLDKPKGEVVIDVIVMEANRARVRDLGATFLTSGAAGIKIPISYGAPATNIPTTGTGTGTTTTTAGSTAVTLNQIKNIGAGDFSVSVPSGILQAVLSDGRTRVLQQPQVRAVEGYKSTLRIGDKIPYATGSFQPGGVGQMGISPLVSTQFSFAEVGVNVDILPKVHGRDEVSMHVVLEISNVSSRIDIGGVSQPIISQKKVEHDIRIREGEVNILGGLMQSQDTKTIAGVPGLASIPIIGHFFGTDHTEKNQGELLIALVPHIVRAPEYTDANLRGIAAGSDQVVKLTYAPRKDQSPKPAVAPPAAGMPLPVNPGAIAPAPAAAAPTTPATPAGLTTLQFIPGNVQTTLGAPVTVSLQVNNVTDLFSAPMKLKFDPKILRLTAIRQGSLLTGDGQKVNFNENTLNDTGEATVVLNRLPGSGGVSGSGGLISLTFQAIGKGSSPVSLSEISLQNSQLQPLSAAPPSLDVIVQ